MDGRIPITQPTVTRQIREKRKNHEWVSKRTSIGLGSKAWRLACLAPKQCFRVRSGCNLSTIRIASHLLLVSQSVSQSVSPYCPLSCKFWIWDPCIICPSSTLSSAAWADNTGICLYHKLIDYIIDLAMQLHRREGHAAAFAKIIQEALEIRPSSVRTVTAAKVHFPTYIPSCSRHALTLVI